MIVFPDKHYCSRCGDWHDVLPVPTKKWGVVRMFFCDAKPRLALGREIEEPEIEFDTQPGLRSNWNEYIAAQRGM